MSDYENIANNHLFNPHAISPEHAATYNIRLNEVAEEKYQAELSELADTISFSREFTYGSNLGKDSLRQFCDYWQLASQRMHQRDARDLELAEQVRKLPPTERRLFHFFNDSWDNAYMRLYDAFMTKQQIQINWGELDALDQQTLADVYCFSWQFQSDLVASSGGVEQSRMVEKKVQVEQQIVPVFIQLSKEFSSQLVEDPSSETALGGLRRIFEVLNNTQAQETAKQILFNENLNRDQRLRILVEYANVFGLMNAIFDLSAQIKKTEENTPLYDQLVNVYRTIQGDTVLEVLKDWEGVYTNYDYGEYKLSDKEEARTRAEADRVEQAVHRHQPDLLPQDGVLVDVGSGVGRNLKELVQRGWRVLGLEYQSGYVDQTKQALTEMGKSKAANDIYQGDWKQLLDVLAIQEESVDAAYAFDRAGSHNPDMLSWMQMIEGKVRAVKKGVGVVILDQPVPEWGYYDFHSNKYADNMEALGIKRSEAIRICDGIVETRKFNRIILSRPQLEAIGLLFGMELEVIDEVDINERVKDVYYEFRRSEDFEPEDIDFVTFRNAIDTLGIIQDRSNDLNTYVPSWEMTVGQAIMMGLGHVDDVNRDFAQQVRESNRNGEMLPVEVRYENGSTYLEISQPSRRRREDLDLPNQE